MGGCLPGSPIDQAIRINGVCCKHWVLRFRSVWWSRTSDWSVSLWVRDYLSYFLSSGSFRFSRFRLSSGWHRTGGTVCAVWEVALNPKRSYCSSCRISNLLFWRHLLLGRKSSLHRAPSWQDHRFWEKTAKDTYCSLAVLQNKLPGIEWCDPWSTPRLSIQISEWFQVHGELGLSVASGVSIP